eukprot:Anaeramoba_flamelloidesc40121_g1_i1.p3 GENE.c40121_g1_i1~~c40121_g1_i1.p3  ORF type:complete len:130 (+),score=9.33 c40121_g1_i1:970-1359(+)
MKKTVFMEKYPVYSLEIKKDETSLENVDQIVSYFKEKIDSNKIAKFIAIFDHFEHTSSIGGEISPDIKDAKNIVFCFGPMIPNTKILAVRPRSIGICELEDSFMIDFLEAPKEQMHEIMEDWAKAIISK